MPFCSEVKLLTVFSCMIINKTSVDINGVLFYCYLHLIVYTRVVTRTRRIEPHPYSFCSSALQNLFRIRALIC